MSSLARIENFINGEFVPTARYLDSYDPSVGEVWAQVPDSGPDDVHKAVEAAKAAFPAWSQTSVQERSRLMMKIADLIEQDLEEIAKIESRDQGKPVWLATKVDIPRTVHNFRFFASTILHNVATSSKIHHPGGEALQYTLHEPIGVAGLISPWNLPLYLLSFKLAPAIAAGNTVVCKPSEMTSVSTEKLCRIFQKVLPPGVVNVVYGTGPRCGNAIVDHPDVPLISFTGSTQTGIRIQQVSAPYVKKLSLELGGKNAAIVFSDADMDKCIDTCIRSSFMNQGEICLCTSRIYVERSIYPTFLDKFITRTRKITVGDPKDDNSFMGALVSKEHLQKVNNYVKICVEEGGRVLCGQGVDELNLPENIKNGYYMPATVLVRVEDHHTVMQEEIFGPVTCIAPFDTEDEVIKRANDVKYGLVGVVWTQDLSRAHRVSSKLEVGTAWVNCWLVRDLNMPFGGCKGSGVGREGAKDSLEFFTEQKNVCIQL